MIPWGEPPAVAVPGQDFAGGHAGGNLLILALGSVGVVFGDIGTSPLYALQTALGQFKDWTRADEVIGVVSLIIWALFIVVTTKYVLFLMQADNKGEGGVLSLMALRRPRSANAPCSRSCSASRAPRCFPATRSSRRRSPCSPRSRVSNRSIRISRRSCFPRR